MKRSRFHQLAKRSLLICVAMLILLLRSYFALDHFTFDRSLPGTDLFYQPPGTPAASMFHPIASHNVFSTHGELGIMIIPSALTNAGTSWGITPGPMVWPYPLMNLQGRDGFYAEGWVAQSPQRPSILIAFWGKGTRYAMIPDWLVILLTAVLPCIALVLMLKKRRSTMPAGCCQICGYDIRATPGRCPECGTPSRMPGWTKR